MLQKQTVTATYESGWRAATAARQQSLSGGSHVLPACTKEGGGACPGAVDQQQPQSQSPGTDRGHQERHEAVGLQEKVAGLCLPEEQQQHDQVNPQGRPAAARFPEVGPEGVAAATVVDAPAEVSGEWHIEEQHLKGKRSWE